MHGKWSLGEGGFWSKKFNQAPGMLKISTNLNTN